MQSKLIVVDVDGVLLDYEAAFSEYHNVDIDKFWANGYVSDPNLQTMFHEFRDSIEFAQIPRVAGAFFAMRLLRDMNYRIIALTACGAEDHVVERRIFNLEREFGPDTFDDIIVRNLKASKQADLDALHQPGALFVDDQMRYIKEGVQAGYHTTYMNTPYNANVDSVPHEQVWGWGEVMRNIYATGA